MQTQQHITVEGIGIATALIVPPVVANEVPIVFLHDSLGCTSVWKDFPARVAELSQRKAYVYDRQGYGQSAPFKEHQRDNGYLEKEANFLVKVLDALEIKECILFGHSDGGSIALIAGAKYPDRIKGIITEGAHVFVEEITLAGIREAVNMYDALKEKLARHHGEKVEALFNAWTQTWLSPPFRRWNIEDFLPRISCPVLVVQGEKDEYGSLEQVDAIYTQVKGPSEKLVVTGVGHTPHREAAAVTLEATVDFIFRVCL